MTQRTIHCLPIVPVLATFCLPVCADEGILTDVLSVRETRKDGIGFSLTATVTARHAADTNLYHVEDDRCGILMRLSGVNRPKPGDLVRLCGLVHQSPDEFSFCPTCTGLVTLARSTHPAPPLLGLRELTAVMTNGLLYRCRGIVRDFVADDIDPGFSYLILEEDHACFYVSIRDPAVRQEPVPPGLIGESVEVSGFCDMRSRGLRAKRGLLFHAISIERLSTPPVDTRLIPVLEENAVTSPQELSGLGIRRLAGTVVARWGGRNLLIRTNSGALSHVTLQEGVPPAAYSQIEIAGMPETDLYRINFTHAHLLNEKPATDASVKSAELVSLRHLCLTDATQPQNQARFFGRLVTVRGTVCELPTVQMPERILIRNDGFYLKVDVSTAPAVLEKLAPGDTVDATGVFVIETDSWQSYRKFPRAHDSFLVLQSENDLAIIDRPSWWTAPRLLLALLSVLGLTLASFIWNTLLRHKAEQRGRELADSAIENAEATLKIYERTRLATELHDSLSQNLTGIALALDEVKDALTTDVCEARARLDIAVRSLKSCRNELRNCLWDLRSEALEEDDLGIAIRRTLAPHVRDTAIAIRFIADRNAFSDNTLHTILCMIRELTVNAIHHGKASTVSIAGTLEDDELRFSVTDDGRGFDPATRPGLDSGHFGLQGVQERAESLGGSVEIRSAPGAGTKVTVSISTPAGKHAEDAHDD